MRLKLCAAVLSTGFAVSAPAAPPAGEPDAAPPRVEVQRFEFNAPGAGPALGVTVKPLTDQLRQELNAKTGAGAVVDRVAPGSAAALAGVKPNDIITAVAGKPVGSPDDLRRLVREQKPGADVDVRLERDGETVTASATLRAGLGGFGFGPPAGPVIEGFAFPHFDFNAVFDQSRKVVELEKRVAELEKRLAELERKAGEPKK